MDETNKNPAKNDKKGIIGLISDNPFYTIILVVFAVHVQILFYDFVLFDDHNFRFDMSANVENLTSFESAVSNPFITTNYYRPLTSATFWLDAQIAGESSFMNHFTNLVLHSLCSCLIFVLLGGLRFSAGTALGLSLIFAVHPILNNAIAWVVGRGDILAAVFIVSSMIILLKYLDGRKWPWLLSYAVLHAAGVFSKETAILAPAFAIFLWWSRSPSRKIDTKNIALFSVWIVPPVMYALLKQLLNIPVGGSNFDFLNILINYRVVPETLYNMLLPFSLETLAMFELHETLAGFVILIWLVFLFIRKFKGKVRGEMLFAVAWLIVPMIPGLFIRLPDETRLSDYVDCRNYIPLAGFIIMLAFLLPEKVTNSFRRVNFYFFLIIIAVLSFFTIIQSRNYKDADSFRESARKVNPGIQAGFTISPELVKSKLHEAARLSDQGKFGLAIAILDTLLGFEPDNSLYLSARGFNKMRQKKFDEAVDDFNKAIKNDPGDLFSVLYRAVIANKRKNHKLANALLDSYIDIRKDNFEAFYHRAVARLGMNNLSGALRDCEKAIELNPRYSDAYLQKGLILLRAGRRNQACENLEKAYKLGNSKAYGLLKEKCGER